MSKYFPLIFYWALVADWVSENLTKTLPWLLFSMKHFSTMPKFEHSAKIVFFKSSKYFGVVPYILNKLDKTKYWVETVESGGLFKFEWEGASPRANWSINKALFPEEYKYSSPLVVFIFWVVLTVWTVIFCPPIYSPFISLTAFLACYVLSYWMKAKPLHLPVWGSLWMST